MPRKKQAFRIEPLYLEDVFGPVAAELVVNARGELVVPGWRRGMTFSALRGLFWQAQQSASLESAAKRLETELEAAQASIDALEARCAWLTRQVRLEGQLGLMLERLAG